MNPAKDLKTEPVNDFGSRQVKEKREHDTMGKSQSGIH